MYSEAYASEDSYATRIAMQGSRGHNFNAVLFPRLLGSAKNPKHELPVHYFGTKTSDEHLAMVRGLPCFPQSGS